MDYSKFTKEQLIAKLEEQQHLAEAVRAKDHEISTAIHAKNDAETKLAEAQSRVKVLEIANDQLRKSAEAQNDLVDKFNKYINFTRNYLRTMQGSLENTIELESTLTQFGK